MATIKSDEIVFVPVPNYCEEWKLYVTREGNLYRRRSYKNGTEKYVKIGSKEPSGYMRFIVKNKGTILRGYNHILIARTFIPNHDEKPFVDHKNGDRTDNRVENLRWCTSSENNRNRKKGEGTTSQYKGVYWNKNMNKWRVHIKMNGQKHIGYFDDEEEAAMAYDDAAHKHFGEYAKLNFPEDYEQVVA